MGKSLREVDLRHSYRVNLIANKGWVESAMERFDQVPQSANEI